MTTLRVFPAKPVMSDKDVQNAINRAVRHCRIGKVRPKPSKLGLPDGWRWPGYNALLVNDSEWWKRHYLPMLPNFATPNTAG